MIEDAISGVYDKGIHEMRNIGVKVTSTEELIREFASRSEEASNSK